MFKGFGNEDPNEFWFVVKSIWETQGVMDDNIKKTTLVNTLQDCVLTWYIKHSSDNLNAGVTDIQTTLNKEFSKSKSEAQSIIGFKEITMLPGETPWKLDQSLKCTIHEANMTLMDGKHLIICRFRVEGGGSAPLLRILAINVGQSSVSRSNKVQYIHDGHIGFVQLWV